MILGGWGFQDPGENGKTFRPVCLGKHYHRIHRAAPFQFPRLRKPAGCLDFATRRDAVSVQCHVKAWRVRVRFFTAIMRVENPGGVVPPANWRGLHVICMFGSRRVVACII